MFSPSFKNCIYFINNNYDIKIALRKNIKPTPVINLKSFSPFTNSGYKQTNNNETIYN